MSLRASLYLALAFLLAACDASSVNTPPQVSAFQATPP